MAPPKNPTRERLLNQAEKLFARKGFEAVSIREITSAARSNLAAVNYHFGNKKNLYREVFRHRWVARTHRVREYFLRQLADNPHPTLPEIIRAMARTFLEGPLDEAEQHYHIQLMQRELAQPSEVLEMVVEEVMKPYQKEITELIRPHLPANVDEERLRLSVLSMLGMTIYFTFARPAVSMVMGNDYNRKRKSVLVEHITDFSLQGLQTLQKEK